MTALAAKYLYPMLLALSLLSSILCGALLMAWHAPLAGPIAPIAARLQAPATNQPRRMLHFLSPNCRCSERLAQYLSSRPPRENLVESVVLLGEGAASTLPQGALLPQSALLPQGAFPSTLDSLRRLGYTVHIGDSEFPSNTSPNKVSPSNGVLGSAAREVPAREVPGGPWLIIEDQNGRVEYSGGYEVAPYWEARILYAVQNRYVQASLPASGCAASTNLRARNFALRLKDLINTL